MANAAGFSAGCLVRRVVSILLARGMLLGGDVRALAVLLRQSRSTL